MENETPIVETKVCIKCGRELPLADFHRNRTKKDGHQDICKECKNRAMNAYNKKLRESRDFLPASNTINSDNPLSKFTGRELLAELKARGYIWDQMYCKTYVEYSKI